MAGISWYQKVAEGKQTLREPN